jgi:lysyl-tRNA synthetase class 2
VKNLEDLRKQRIEKLERLNALGESAFDYAYPRSHSAQEILSDFPSLNKEGQEVALAGRLMSLRRMGKASFGHIMDQTGRIQIYVKEDLVGDKVYGVFRLIDLGDILGVKGTVFQTRTGETTIMVRELRLLAKSLRPLPIVKEKILDEEKIVYDAFKDIEMRYRQRYVDLVVNPDVRELFEKRSQIVTAMRRYLGKRGYVEVETPVLQPIYGGAFARPFITHHHSLDRDFYLRIADELYLKRLIVGGFEGVFEIAKDFRNEGLDRDHNPEFTMMELYVAYEDYQFMMDLVEDMVSSISREINGSTIIRYGEEEIDLKPPWKRISFFESILQATGIEFRGLSQPESQKAAKELSPDLDEIPTQGKLFDEVFSRFVYNGLSHGNLPSSEETQIPGGIGRKV